MVVQIKESEQELDEELKETRFRVFLIYLSIQAKPLRNGHTRFCLELSSC